MGVRNRFKGSHLTDRVREELQTEVCAIVQETEIKTIPKIKKHKRATWLSEETLQTDEKRRKVKGKGEKERYTHLNASKEKQGKIRKPSSVINAKKQWKIIEWERLEILFKKIRDTKGTFHAKMGTIKDRNGMDLTEAEDILKRWQEYKEKLYKKDLHNPDNHDGVITHLEPDIVKCKDRWALGSIDMNKASGGNRIPVELFQTLKDEVVKVLHSICQQIGKIAVAHRTGKCPFSFLSQRKAMLKNVQTTTPLHSSYMLEK